MHFELAGIDDQGMTFFTFTFAHVFHNNVKDFYSFYFAALAWGVAFFAHDVVIDCVKL
mgnify:CR=1 FL=1